MKRDDLPFQIAIQAVPCVLLLTRSQIQLRQIRFLILVPRSPFSLLQRNLTTKITLSRSSPTSQNEATISSPSSALLIFSIFAYTSIRIPMPDPILSHRSFWADSWGYTLAIAGYILLNPFRTFCQGAFCAVALRPPGP